MSFLPAGTQRYPHRLFAGNGEGAGWLLPLAAGIAMAGVLFMVLMIVVSALPALGQSGGGSPFTLEWQPYQGRFGILPMLAGSLALALFAIMLGFPVAFGVCAWLLAVGEGRRLLACGLRGVIRFMTAIPTVVYGFAAVFLLAPLIREGVGGTGMCLLTAGLVLALLIVPTMVLVLEAGFLPRMEALCPGGLALGFSRLELFTLFVVRGGRSVLVNAALLGFGRAVGDTLIGLMLAGNSPQFPGGLLESLRTLTAHMAMATANEVGGAAHLSLFAAGFLLLVLNIGISLAVRRIGGPKR